MAMNLANHYSNVVDERFARKSYSDCAVGNAYTWGNNKTVTVYSVPTAPMVDYTRHPSTPGADRYGSAFELQASTQDMAISKDRSFNIVIDRGDLIQSEMVMEANKALKRQLDEVAIPEYDAYVFTTLANKASGLGNMSTTTPTKSNAYDLFLAGQEHLGNHMAPTEGRVALCSYKFANLLKQDVSFTRDSDIGQEMLRKGEIGTVDGTRIIQVPSAYLPNGASCIITHPYATVAPKQLYEYKIHDNPPGISGYKIEGRMIYDCFVLNNKVNGIYYIGASGVLRVLDVVSSPSVTAGKTAITVAPIHDAGGKWVYKTGTTLTAVEYGDALTTGWTDLAASGTIITPTSSHTIIQVAELDSAGKAVGHGVARLNIG